MKLLAPRSCPVHFVIAIMFCVGSAAWAACPQGEFVGHFLGGNFARCADSRPLAGFAFALAAPDSINSNDQDLVCEAESAPSDQDVGCSSRSGTEGDGRVTVYFDWSRPGSLGCPVPYGQSGADGRIVLILAASDGSSLVTSFAYAPDFALYPVEAAQPYPGTTISPLTCGAPGGNVLRVDQITESGGQVSANVTLFAPHVFSDCEPGTVGQFLGTCPYGPAIIPAVTPGRLYSRTGPWPELGGEVPLRTGAWTFAAAPDPNGHASVSRPGAPQGECLFLGATLAMGGVESPAIGGFVRHPAPACRDADFDGIADCNGDCNDSNAEVFPGHAEACDGVDNDCDGAVDEDGVCSLTCPIPGKIGADVRVTYNGPQGSVYPALVRAGDGYGVAWTDGRDDPVTGIYFARLDASGGKIGDDVRVNAGDSFWLGPRMARTDSGFGFLWQDYVPTDPSTGTSAIRFAHLDAAGQKVGDDFRLTGERDLQPSIV